MSSLYYANALFSKYQAASSVFPSGVFPEQTSCAFASNTQRAGYGAASTPPFAASMPGLYSSGSSVHPQPPNLYSSGYGLEAGSFNMHCSPFEQNLSMMCPGDASKQNCSKTDQRDSDLQGDSNFRIYPWMRSTGKGRQRGSARRRTRGGGSGPGGTGNYSLACAGGGGGGGGGEGGGGIVPNSFRDVSLKTRLQKERGVGGESHTPPTRLRSSPARQKAAPGALNIDRSCRGRAGAGLGADGAAGIAAGPFLPSCIRGLGDREMEPGSETRPWEVL